MASRSDSLPTARVTALHSDPPPEPAEIRRNEDSYLESLLASARTKDDERQPIAIVRFEGEGEDRKEVSRLTFTVRPITDREIASARRDAQRVVNDPITKQRVVEVDDVKFRSLVIYRATVPDDRRRLWDNEVAHDKLGVNPMETWGIIDRVLKPGEKARVFAKIEEVSGYALADESEVEAAAKN